MLKKERPPSLGASLKSLSPSSSQRFLSPQGNRHLQSTKTASSYFPTGRTEEEKKALVEKLTNQNLLASLGLDLNPGSIDRYGRKMWDEPCLVKYKGGNAEKIKDHLVKINVIPKEAKRRMTNSEAFFEVIQLLNSSKLKSKLPAKYDQMVNFYRTYLELDQERKSPTKNKFKTQKSPSPTKEALMKSPSAKQLSNKKVVKSAVKQKPKPEIEFRKDAPDIPEQVLAKWAKLAEALLENRYQKLMRNITRKFLKKLENRGRWEGRPKTSITQSQRKTDGEEAGFRSSPTNQKEINLAAKETQLENPESTNSKKKVVHSSSTERLGNIQNDKNKTL